MTRGGDVVVFSSTLLSISWDAVKSRNRRIHETEASGPHPSVTPLTSNQMGSPALVFSLELEVVDGLATLGVVPHRAEFAAGQVTGRVPCVQNIAAQSSHDFIGSVTEDPFGSRVPRNNHTVRIDRRNAIGGSRQERFEIHGTILSVHNYSP